MSTAQAAPVPLPIRYWVPGLPVSQGSKSRNRHGVMYEANAALKPWRNRVMWETSNQVIKHALTPYATARVTLVFALPRPKAHLNTRGTVFPRFRETRHTVKPDIDKLTRAVLDGMTYGGIIEDDARIDEIRVQKRYTEPDRPDDTGCLIIVQA